MKIRRCFLWLVLCSVVALTGACSSEATRHAPAVTTAATTIANEPEIHMSLLPGVKRIAPGQSFAIGVRFQIPKGWHIYWQNPGDAGMATKVSVNGPDGFAIGSPRFPGPRRFVTAGDIVSFGWEGEAVVVTEVTSPSDATGDARFEIEGRWLACKDTCVPGKATAVTTLPIGDPTDGPVTASETELRPRHLALLPRPASELGEVHATCGSHASGLSVVVPGASGLEFFPARALGAVTQSFVPTSSTLELEIGPAVNGTRPALDGVLLVRTNTSHEHRYYDVSGFCTSRAGS